MWYCNLSTRRVFHIFSYKKYEVKISGFFFVPWFFFLSLILSWNPFMRKRFSTNWLIPSVMWTILTFLNFISSLQLSGILLDTGNLTHPSCTPKDKYMATLLLNGAGRFGGDGLYQICMIFNYHCSASHSFPPPSNNIWRPNVWFAVRYKMYDISDLKVADILRKDFKIWSGVGLSSTWICLSSYIYDEIHWS